MDKVAVIGLGNIATRHRHNLKTLYPSAKLFAMSASGRRPTSSISDCDQLVFQIDELITHRVELVIIASPAPFHAHFAVPLIEACIPTLIEKPVTTTIDDAKLIQRAVEKYKSPVAIGYCLRYLPSAIKLRSILEEKEVGILFNAHIEIGQYLPGWRPDKDYRDSVSANKRLGGGVLFELSHELDYAQWLLGPLFLQYAKLRSSQLLDIDVDDIADIVVVNEAKTLAVIHLDFLQPKAHRQCSFVGSEGRVEWDLIKNKIVLIKGLETRVLYNEPEYDKNKMYLAMIEDFVQMIHGNTHTCTSLEEAMATVSLISEIELTAGRK